MMVRELVSHGYIVAAIDHLCQRPDYLPLTAVFLFMMPLKSFPAAGQIL
ncbi:MAG: hypothetical protein H6656_03865 [Ardenticatenaceae bacterium]|nr:hypothetical protein [Ardenticatenaceae bacterium]